MKIIRLISLFVLSFLFHYSLVFGAGPSPIISHKTIVNEADTSEKMGTIKNKDDEISYLSYFVILMFLVLVMGFAYSSSGKNKK